MEKSYFINDLNNLTFDNDGYNQNSTKSQKSDIANFIRNNSQLIKQDEHFSHFLLKKIYSHSKLIKELFKFEFLNYNPDISEKVYSIDKIVNIALKELNRYQGVIGAYEVEDFKWIVCDKSTERFKIKENQIIIYNSVPEKACYDKDYIWFLKHFVIHIKKFLDTNNIKINYKIIDDEDHEIFWSLFIFEKQQVYSDELILEDELNTCLENN